jgi:hypothetical protein
MPRGKRVCALPEAGTFFDPMRTTQVNQAETTTTGFNIIAKIRPEELEKVKELAGGIGHEPGLVALALADLGETMTTDDAVAREVEDGANAAKFLRLAITRDASACTAELPMPLDPFFADEQREEARKIGREIGEWTGAMIGLGLLVSEKRQAVLAAQRDSFFEVYADAKAYNLAHTTAQGGAA